MNSLTNDQLLAELKENSAKMRDAADRDAAIRVILAERGQEAPEREFLLMPWGNSNPILTDRNYRHNHNGDQWLGFSIYPPNGSTDRCLKTGLRRFRGFFK